MIAARGSSRFLYFFAGRALHVSGTPVPEPALIAVDPDAAIRLEAAGSAIELLMLQGKPIAEPVAQHGPFVMNTRAELQQAFADYQRTQFGGWPWGAADPVNGREGRFARRPVGTVERMSEGDLDLFTGVAGSGPAYVFLVAAALTEAAVAEGMSRPVAERVIRQLLLGSATLLDREGDPAVLRERVTSPGGTTAAGLAVLDERGVRAAFGAAVRAATERSRELG